MKRSIEGFLSALFLTAISLTVIQAETITLQQGINGYTGCQDSYIEYSNQYANNGSSTTMVVKEQGG
jgi:hypothetical protein